MVHKSKAIDNLPVGHLMVVKDIIACLVPVSLFTVYFFCELVMSFPFFSVPQVLKSCTDFIEKYGVVDGIYRLSGIASNIQKLR